VVVSLAGAVSLLGRFPALAGADLEITAGEIVLLEGPNGAGKSTLLRLCAGLAPLHQGRGQVLGHDLSKRASRRALRRHVGLLGHATALYDELTVEQNVRFWARANGATEAEIEPALDALGLAGRLRSVPVAGLSAGQRRRTSMAVLVCRRPTLWLLDEPHAGLDRAGRDLIDDLARRAVAAGASVILASHEADRAAGIATMRVGVVGGQTTVLFRSTLDPSNSSPATCAPSITPTDEDGDAV
jgi:heme ABC exporter ATP-binding subunit CcmA